MQTPKSQKELLQLLQEQDKRIEEMRKAIIRLESKLKMAVTLSERVQGQNRRLQEQTAILTTKLVEVNARIGRG